MQQKQLIAQTQEPFSRNPCSCQWQIFSSVAEYPENDAARYLHGQILYHFTALGISTKLNGYRCLVTATKLLCEDRSLVMKQIYPEVAKINNLANGACVERNIRTVLTKAWDNRKNSCWEFYFPMQTQRPSNKEFISRIAELL